MSGSSRCFWKPPYGGEADNYKALLIKCDELRACNLQMTKETEETRLREIQLKSEYDAILGKVEYENEVLKSELKALKDKGGNLQENLEKKVSALKEELIVKEELLNSRKRDLQVYETKQRDMEVYLAAVPTPADYGDFMKQFEELKEKNEKIIQQNKDLNKKCSEKDKRIRDETVALKAFEDREHILQMHIDDLTEKLSQLSSKRSVPRLDRDVIDDLKSDARRWKTNYDILLQQMNIFVKKADEKQEYYETQLKEVNETLGAEKGIVRSLEKMLDDKSNELSKQRNRITGLVADKQNLMSTLIDVQEKAKLMDEMMETGWFKKQGIIATNLWECVQDIKNLLRVINLCVQGERPDHSMLFSIPDKCPAFYSNKEFNMTLSFQQLDGSVKQIEELRNDINSIRRLISDRLAENIGSEVTCIVQ